MRLAITALAASLALPLSANAATIINGSFEQGTPPGGFTTVGTNGTNIAGWTVTSGSVDYIGNYWTAADGSRSIDLAGNQPGIISQILSTVIGQVYNVTFSISRNPDNGANPRNGFVTWTGASNQAFSFNNTSSTRSNMLWEQRTVQFTATSTSTTLGFGADPASSQNAFGPALDNVTIAAVPEPSTWLMLLAGFGLVGGAMRRRKQAGETALA
jgi:choice-of-anchor C domain-containing protein